MAITKEQAIEILDFFDFFQGQRAGRELWAEKPYEVQEEDLAYFSERISLLKEYIANVVPKSEVERLQKEANRYKRYFFRHDYDEMIAEVLDKLDRFINANCIEIKDERGIKGYVTSSVHFSIAELKKKYTGEQT